MRAAGRSLSHKVYLMISYVEEKQEPDKVIRETKFLPKLVLRIETFNKYVIHLSKKTKSDLASYIHIGRVRYFRIKSLQEALDRTIDPNDVDESNLEDQEENNDSLSDSESLGGSSSQMSSTTTCSTLTNDTDVGFTKVKRNMARINKQTKRAHKASTKEKEAPPSKRRKTKSKN